MTGYAIEINNLTILVDYNMFITECLGALIPSILTHIHRLVMTPPPGVLIHRVERSGAREVQKG